MKKNLKLLISSAFFALAFLVPQIHSSQAMENPIEEEGSPGIPIHQNEQIEERRRIFQVREAGIEQLINQYYFMAASSMNYGELLKCAQTIIDIYTVRKQNLNIPLPNILASRNERSALDLRKEVLLASHDYKRTYQFKANYPFYPSKGSFWGPTVGIQHVLEDWRWISEEVKTDVLESMEMYRELYDAPHPRWGVIGQDRKNTGNVFPPVFPKGNTIQSTPKSTITTPIAHVTQPDRAGEQIQQPNQFPPNDGRAYMQGFDPDTGENAWIDMEEEAEEDRRQERRDNGWDSSGE
jgi:hypothetical protein